MRTTRTRDIKLQIVEACERVIARIGYERMTMGDVAAEAGLARRTLYLHFRTKEALATETVQNVVRRVLSAMEECLNGTTGSDALRAMLIARVTVRIEVAGPYHHSLDDIMRALHPHNSKFHLAHYEREIVLIQRAIERGMEDGSLHCRDPREDSEMLVRATNSYLPSNLSVTDASDLPGFRRKVERLSSVLCAGLANPRSRNIRFAKRGSRR